METPTPHEIKAAKEPRHLFAALALGVAGMLVVTRWAYHFGASSELKKSEGMLMALDIMHLTGAALVLSSALVLCSAFYRFLRGKIAARRLVFLCLPAVSLTTAFAIPFPRVKETLIRVSADEKTLVEVAARLATAPPDWVARDTVGLERESDLKAWFASQPALTALGFEHPSHVFVRDSTVSLEWGSPVSYRWGIAISTKTDWPPQVRSGAIETKRIYPSVALYEVED